MQARTNCTGPLGLSLILAVGYFPGHMAVLLLMGSWWWSFAERQYGRNLIVRRSGEVNIVRYGRVRPAWNSRCSMAVHAPFPHLRTVTRLPLEEYVVPSAVIPATEIAQVGDPALLGGLSNASAGKLVCSSGRGRHRSCLPGGIRLSDAPPLGILEQARFGPKHVPPRRIAGRSRDPGRRTSPTRSRRRDRNLGVDTYSGPGAVVLNQKRIPDRLTFAVPPTGSGKST